MDDSMWRCMGCGAEIHDYADVGYDGPADRSSQRCDPFSPWETLCVTCEEKRTTKLEEA